MAGASCRVEAPAGRSHTIDVSGLADWIETWREAEPGVDGDDGWVSCEQLQAAWEVGYGQTLRRIKRLIADGLACSERRPIINIAGDKTMAIRYRLVEVGK